MHKKIILLLLTLSSMHASQKNISLLQNHYKNNKYKKQRLFDGKYLMASYKKPIDKSSKQIRHYYNNMQWLAHCIKMQQQENCIPESRAALLKIQEGKIFHLGWGRMRARYGNFILSKYFLPITKNTSLINEIDVSLTQLIHNLKSEHVSREELNLAVELDALKKENPLYDLTDGKELNRERYPCISKIFDRSKQKGYLASWHNPKKLQYDIPKSLLRNKKKFPFLFLLFIQNFTVAWKENEHLPNELELRKILFTKKLTEEIFKEVQLREKACEIPRELFYSPFPETFNLWKFKYDNKDHSDNKSYDSGEYSENSDDENHNSIYAHFDNNINIWAYLLIKKFTTHMLSKLSFHNLCQFYFAFYDKLLSPEINNGQIICNDNFDEIVYQLIEAITIKINDAAEKNLCLSDLSLLFKIIDFETSNLYDDENSINKEFIKSIKNYILKCIKRKSFFINNFDIKKLSKDNNKFKTWMKNLITILKANMEPYYTELSVFLLNNPYETLIKNNEKNEDKYNKVLKTMLLIEKLQRFLAILNRKPSEILIK